MNRSGCWGQADPGQDGVLWGRHKRRVRGLRIHPAASEKEKSHKNYRCKLHSAPLLSPAMWLAGNCSWSTIVRRNRHRLVGSKARRRPKPGVRSRGLEHIPGNSYRKGLHFGGTWARTRMAFSDQGRNCRLALESQTGRSQML